MSRLYGEQHRRLQERFDTQRLADRIEAIAVRTTVEGEDAAFIASRDMFFLSTVDHRGRPTVSYKGGDPGFVRVLDPGTIAFPSFDGNGMFYSMGNIAGNPNVGMLFIDFEKPHRLRLHGTASIDPEDPLLGEYVEADMVVRVRVQEVFANCPRYIHRYRKVAPSRYVPRQPGDTPLAEWKRVDLVQDALPERDRGRAAEVGGTITIEEYFEKVKSGDG